MKPMNPLKYKTKTSEKNRVELDNVAKTGIYTCSKFGEWGIKAQLLQITPFFFFRTFFCKYTEGVLVITQT
jgi:hypothetical protein